NYVAHVYISSTHINPMSHITAVSPPNHSLRHGHLPPPPTAILPAKTFSSNERTGQLVVPYRGNRPVKQGRSAHSVTGRVTHGYFGHSPGGENGPPIRVIQPDQRDVPPLWPVPLIDRTARAR